MSPVIELEGVVAVSGRFPVLTGVDLVVESGAIVMLEAPNGAGKTSLLRLCAGLLAVRSGRAVVAGADLTADRRLVRPMVAYVGHGAGLYPQLTVRQNLRFWVRAGFSQVGDQAAAQPSAGASLEGDCDAVLDAVGVPERSRDLPVFQLSEGQQKRTALGVAISRRALVWLLDEPHAGLDNGGRADLDRLIRAASDAGATIMFSSHEGDRARRVADRVIQMGAGRVLGETR